MEERVVGVVRLSDKTDVTTSPERQRASILNASAARGARIVLRSVGRWGGGLAPCGYRAEPEPNGTGVRLVEDHDAAEAVREIVGASSPASRTWRSPGTSTPRNPLSHQPAKPQRRPSSRPRGRLDRQDRRLDRAVRTHPGARRIPGRSRTCRFGERGAAGPRAHRRTSMARAAGGGPTTAASRPAPSGIGPPLAGRGVLPRLPGTLYQGPRTG